jgi:hypothetical protein
MLAHAQLVTCDGAEVHAGDLLAKIQIETTRLFEVNRGGQGLLMKALENRRPQRR